MSPRTTADHLPTPPDPDPTSSLAGVEVGAEIRVDRILLDLARVMCREHGISVGDRLRIEARSNDEVLVRNEEGRSARLPQPYAFFVRVRPGDSEGDARGDRRD